MKGLEVASVDAPPPASPPVAELAVVGPGPGIPCYGQDTLQSLHKIEGMDVKLVLPELERIGFEQQRLVEIETQVIFGGGA